MCALVHVFSAVRKMHASISPQVVRIWSVYMDSMIINVFLRPSPGSIDHPDITVPVAWA